MKGELYVYDASTETGVGNFYGNMPTKCPYCNLGIMPKHLNSHLTNTTYYSDEFVFSMFLCPNCAMIFLAEFKADDSSISLQRVYPATTQKIAFKENISNLSPSFCKIYNEAFLAEQQGLLEICGMGYRKALEFLIKDFAIHENPNNKEQIISKMLSKCIQDHISNPKIQSLAKASAWLGNDETHYERKHSDYDISDMKKFINAAVSFIDCELEVSNACALLNTP